MSTPPAATPSPAPAGPGRSRRRYVLFAAVAAGVSVLFGLATLLAADVYMHRRAERSAGLNAWGYRGPVVGSKGPGEARIAFLGGSTMFGYGVTWEEAIPALVEGMLNDAEGPPVRSVNLAMNNEGAYSFLYTLQDYAYLDADIVVLYEGYNDLQGDDGGGNRSLYRHESPVFRLTGYYPILPLVFKERAMMMRYGGDLAAAYAATGGEGPTTVFRPGLADGSAAAALEAATAVSDSFSRRLDGLTKPDVAPQEGTGAGECRPLWSLYCEWIRQAIEHALGEGQLVVVASQPSVPGHRAERHVAQRLALIRMLTRHYTGDRRVRHVDLSAAVNLDDEEMSFDRMHLTVQGNRRIATALAAAIQPFVVQVQASRR